MDETRGRYGSCPRRGIYNASEASEQVDCGVTARWSALNSSKSNKEGSLRPPPFMEDFDRSGGMDAQHIETSGKPSSNPEDSGIIDLEETERREVEAAPKCWRGLETANCGE